MGLASELTFVSTTGPTLDQVSAKAMRAHTTRENFRRRRQRLVREYEEHKDRAALRKPARPGDQPSTILTPVRMVKQPSFERRLSGENAFMINFCM